MKDLTTFHLYHHQPDSLPLEAVRDQAWLLNNAVAYSMVAVIDAPNVSTALQAAQCKALARPLPRATAVRAGNLFRETLPGDVLVTARDAWMVDSTPQVRQVAYPKSQNRRRFGQRSTIDDLAWSPDGRLLAVAENDRRVVLRTLESNGDDLYPTAYTRGEYAAAHLAWSPDGVRLASAGYHGEVHIWRPAPWSAHGFSPGHTGSILICHTEEVAFSYEQIHCLAWTPDGQRIVAGREDGCLISWNAQTGSGYRLKPRHAKALTVLAFSPREEHLLLTASADTTIRIWDEEYEREQTRYSHTSGVMAAVWSPDGQLVASCEQEDPTVALWRSQTGDLMARIPLSIYTTQKPTIRSLAWSPDGAFLAAGCDDGTVQLIDLALSRHVQTYWTHATDQPTVQALAWSPDGTLLASGGTSAVVDIWQVCSSQARTEAAVQPVSAEEASR